MSRHFVNKSENGDPTRNKKVRNEILHEILNPSQNRFWTSPTYVVKKSKNDIEKAQIDNGDITYKIQIDYEYC